MMKDLRCQVEWGKQTNNIIAKGQSNPRLEKLKGIHAERFFCCGEFYVGNFLNDFCRGKKEMLTLI